MKILIKKYLDESISPDERKILESWVLDSDENRSLFKKELLAYNSQSEYDFDIEAAFKRFNLRIVQKRSASKVRKLHTVYKYAAVFIGLAALGFFGKSLILDPTLNLDNPIVTAQSSGDVDAIVIKLADGTTQILNEEDEAAITDANGNLVASKKETTLRFKKSDDSSTELVYNEIIIPNGKKLKLELSDGSVVWLNSGSRFKFPQEFIPSKKTRKVFLVGEAFFEVAKDKTHPFIVDAGELDVTVLGTQFNVSAYDTNEAVATTLVEGSVSVYTSLAREKSTILVPSEQLRYNTRAKSNTKEIVDTSIYTAWINDKLIINSLRFDEILRRLERRDDVIIINNSINLNQEVFIGEFTNESVETILKTMVLSTPFKYIIKGQTITITNN